MIGRFLLSFGLGIIWILISDHISIEAFLIGSLFGFVILTALRIDARKVKLSRLPGQLLGFALYTIRMMADIFLSSLDVARRVLSPRLELRTGIIAVPTQNHVESDFETALSAHSITITPGELVVEFKDHEILFVHCLDVESSEKTLFKAQERRIKLIHQILGER